jgi:hypothetical protein
MTSIFKRYLISDQQLIDKIIGELTLVFSDNDNWTKTYLNITTGDKWIYYSVDTGQQGGGYRILSRLPFPNTDELIEIALHSQFDDEIFAACRTLIDKEGTKKNEFRMDIIDKLERIRDKIRRKRIIELIGLTSPLNRRDILGKTIDQINSDAKYFEDIANRAKKLY